MADSAVAITAGSGVNIDTRTEGTNSHHRQVIVIGDPAANAGVAPVDGTAGLKVDLGADNDVTVTGTVDLGSTDNAVLDGINSNTSTIAGAVSGSEMQVDIVSGTVTANLSATDNGVLDNIDTNTTNIPDALAGEYETVAASQTTQTLGATGGTGDYLDHLLVVPATTSPGNVQIKDGAGSAITVFTGGASSVSNLVPFSIPLGLYSAAGAWQVTTGANVSVIAAGNFT